MSTFGEAVAIQEELRKMAMESDCGQVDTEKNRQEAKKRIMTRREELMEKARAKDRSMYGG